MAAYCVQLGCRDVSGCQRASVNGQYCEEGWRAYGLRTAGVIASSSRPAMTASGALRRASSHDRIGFRTFIEVIRVLRRRRSRPGQTFT